MSEESVVELPMIATERIGKVTIITFLVDRILETSVIDAVRVELIAAVSPRRVRKVIVDFKEDFDLLIGSVLLGTLHRMHRILKEHGGKLLLCDMVPETRKIFAITGLDRVIPIKTNRAAALSAINEK